MKEVRYTTPELLIEVVCAERGFVASNTLDDMYETNGEWE